LCAVRAFNSITLAVTPLGKGQQTHHFPAMLSARWTGHIAPRRHEALREELGRLLGDDACDGLDALPLQVLFLRPCFDLKDHEAALPLLLRVTGT
jgi:hypothetical protein